MRSPRRLRFAASAEHAGDADRTQYHRQRLVATEQRRAQVERGHVLQHALAQHRGVQVVDVAAAGDLRKGGPVGIVEQETRQPPPGGGAEVVDGGDDRHRAAQAIVQPPSIAIRLPVI